jgi:hypothetical protein
MKTLLKASCAIAVVLSALSIDERLFTATAPAGMSSAQAIIGRPLTPLSYAGVARRTTRRAIVGGAVVGGAVAVAPVVVAPAGRCVQAVDAYGRIYTRCY